MLWLSYVQVKNKLKRFQAQLRLIAMVLNFCEILVMQFLNMPQTGFRLGRALMWNDKVVGFLNKVVEGCYFLNILDEILC